MENKSVLDLFHPVVKDWFAKNIGVPSPPQEQGWPVIHRGENVLISAPTGAGKTLAAFLVCINWLLEQGIKGTLRDQTYVLYISPLKALNNDIYRNLELPLEGIEKECADREIPFPDIRKAVRTGDTPPGERQKMLRRPPHILITTPESLYLLLTSQKSRNILKSIRYVIVDEIHALLGGKRGAHLTLSLERLRHLTGEDFVRIGLSATVNPMEEAARFLGGCMRQKGGWGYRPVAVVAPDMKKKVNLEVIVPVHDYRVLEEGTIWPSIYETIYRYILEHKSTLVFVNNRTNAEKIAANLNFIAMKPIAQTHHGSISREARLKVEQQLKSGEIPCLVATSSLELGIDIGDIELIIQVASPKSAARGLQRLGRAGHRLNAVSKGRIIPRTRGDLLDSVVISREMVNKNIEENKVPKNALDIVSQHLVSMACTEDWKLTDILELLRSAYPFHTIKKEEVIRVLNMLSGEYEHREDIPSRPRIYWDRVNQVMMGNNYSRMLAVSGCGTIPDRGYFGVYLEDRTTRLGELDEEFVFEARINDRFLLGTSAWRIVKIERDRVLVAPAGYSGAKTPFWKGDGLGRPYELGLRYGAFIRELGARAGTPEFSRWLMEHAPVKEEAAENLEEYILEQKKALGTLSSERRILVECFGDEAGDTRMVIHSHFGGRVNSGLSVLLEHALTGALHCEAETNYTDDGVLIHLVGLSAQPRNIFSLLDSRHVEEVLIDTLPLTHVYAMAFRYNASRALMMGTGTRGKRNPLWIQRLRGLEALKLAQKYTDHPLVIETFRECLEYIMDVPHLIQVLRDIEAGRIEVAERFVNKPSPFSSELLFNFIGFAMYDDQVQKTMESGQKILSGKEALHLNYRMEGQELISETAIGELSAHSHPLLGEKPPRSANELHGMLLTYGDLYPDGDIYRNLSEEDRKALEEWFRELCASGRAAAIGVSSVVPPNGTELRAEILRKFPDHEEGKAGNRQHDQRHLLWVAAEELPLYRTALGSGLSGADNADTAGSMDITGATGIAGISGTGDGKVREAQMRIIRRFARYNSPFQSEDLTKRYGFAAEIVEDLLERLEREQILIYGSFRRDAGDEWYHSTVLERLRHGSMRESRRSTKTADTPAFADFLCIYQRIGKDWAVPAEGLLDVILQFRGYYLPAEWWETILFPARVPGYQSSWLDALCSSGKVFWRVRGTESGGDRLLLAFFTAEDLDFTGGPADRIAEKRSDGKENACANGNGKGNDGIAGNMRDLSNAGNLTEREEHILSVLKRRGASFLHVLAADPSVDSGNLLADMEDLFRKGYVVNDSFEAVRYFLSDVSDNAKRRAQKRSIAYRMEMGRWEIPQPVREPNPEELLERYLKRWGLLTREIFRQEEPSYTWTDAYERLKKWEYIGRVKRGYYFSGLSGIQYTLPYLSEQFPSSAEEYTVLAGCDPAQAYGRICSFPDGISWTNLPSTAVVLRHGVPVLAAERWGERITVRAKDRTQAPEGTAEDTAVRCMEALADAFHGGRIWPNRRKITVRQWNGNPPALSDSMEGLRKLGFEREMQEAVLWRKIGY